MKRPLLMASALIELPAGLILLAAPSFFVALLLGMELNVPALMVMGRIAGAALLALAATCWLARSDSQNRAARAIIVGMLVYNLGAASILTLAGLTMGSWGIGLWPGVGLHAVMAAWCGNCLRTRSF